MSWCRAQPGTFDQRFFSLKVTVLSFLGRPLWREVGSVMCQSLSLKSTTVSNYLQLFTPEFEIYKVLNTFTKTIKYVQYVQASFSPGFVQQIMPYLLVTYSTTAVLDTWTVVHMTAAKFEPLIFQKPMQLGDRIWAKLRERKLKLANGNPRFQGGSPREQRESVSPG
jgi:hypothetical protein